MTKTIYHHGYRCLINRLRQARISRGLTQRDVAEQVGRRRAWVGKIELCEIRLDVVALVRVA